MALRFDTAEESVTKIKVIGVGGGGNNTIDRMVKSNLQGAEFIAVNTDLQQLNRSLAPVKLQIGQHISDGKGCGADPLKGRRCAEESREELRALLQDTDLLFVTAGMGGGTGTGAAAVIAELAKELGFLPSVLSRVPLNLRVLSVRLGPKPVFMTFTSMWIRFW
jgi:cell division protein FtsZ